MSAPVKLLTEMLLPVVASYNVTSSNITSSSVTNANVTSGNITSVLFYWDDMQKLAVLPT
jgi:hypothetical protein